MSPVACFPLYRYAGIQIAGLHIDVEIYGETGVGLRIDVDDGDIDARYGNSFFRIYGTPLDVAKNRIYKTIPETIRNGISIRKKRDWQWTRVT